MGKFSLKMTWSKEYYGDCLIHICLFSVHVDVS